MICAGMSAGSSLRSHIQLERLAAETRGWRTENRLFAHPCRIKKRIDALDEILSEIISYRDVPSDQQIPACLTFTRVFFLPATTLTELRFTYVKVR